MRAPNKREWALLALLPVAIYFAFISDGEGTDIAAPAVSATRTRTAHTSRSPDAGGLDLALLRREADAAEPGNAFEPKSWYVPPPPPPPAPVVVLPPPVPTAPPLPFTFLGLYEDSGKPVVFLTRGDRVLAVRAGEVIEGTYRVDGIAGSNLALTYLPLNIRQSLFIGNAG